MRGRARVSQPERGSPPRSGKPTTATVNDWSAIRVGPAASSSRHRRGRNSKIPRSHRRGDSFASGSLRLGRTRFRSGRSSAARARALDHDRHPATRAWRRWPRCTRNESAARHALSTMRTPADTIRRTSMAARRGSGGRAAQPQTFAAADAAVIQEPQTIPVLALRARQRASRRQGQGRRYRLHVAGDGPVRDGRIIARAAATPLSMIQRRRAPANLLKTRLGSRAFVLRYRRGPQSHHPIELGDMQRPCRDGGSARGRVAHIAPDTIGVMGFSAGRTPRIRARRRISTPARPTRTIPSSDDGRRPDFEILAYPGDLVVEPFHAQGSKTTSRRANDQALDAGLSCVVGVFVSETQSRAKTQPASSFTPTPTDGASRKQRGLFPARPQGGRAGGAASVQKRTARRRTSRSRTRRWPSAADCWRLAAARERVLKDNPGRCVRATGDSRAGDRAGVRAVGGKDPMLEERWRHADGVRGLHGEGRYSGRGLTKGRRGFS